MSPPSSLPHSDRVRRTERTLVQSLYSSLYNPKQLQDLFSAADEFLASELQENDRTPWSDPRLMSEFKDAEFLAAMLPDTVQSPVSYVMEQRVPTMVVGPDLCVVSANEALAELHDLSTGESLVDALTPSDARAITALSRLPTQAQPTLVYIALGAEPQIALAERVMLMGGNAEEDGDLRDGQAFASLKILQPSWNADVAELLSRQFSLTAAEVAIIADFVELMDVEGVAEKRKTSLRTVRTQLSSIYRKTETRGQLQLMGLVVTLGLLMPSTEWQKEDGATKLLRPKSIKLTSGTLSYFEFGPATGRPVLVLNNSFRPTLTPSLVAELVNQDLRLFVPVKPGSASTSHRPKTVGPDALADDYAELLRAVAVDSCTVLGLHSAGLNALTFARSYPGLVNRVVLSDTGVPYAGRSEIFALPPSVRRTMLAARYVPEILYAPHKIVARLFHRSAEGERRVVDYFFADSAADAKLCQTRKEFHRLTRDTIAYSFEDVDRLVADVCRWAGDWSDLLADVAASKELCFVHGDQNLMFPITPVQEFCARSKGRAVLITVENEGQLQAFSEPRHVSRALVAEWAALSSPAAIQ